MSGLVIKDNAYGTITSTIGTGASRTGMTINLTAGHGARFAAALGTDEHMVAVLQNQSGQLEPIKITAISGDVITANGAQLGFSAKAFAPGDFIGLRINTGWLAEFLRLGAYNTHCNLGGTINAITGTIATGLRALIDGFEFTGKASGANDGASTVTLNLTLDAAALGGSTTATGAKNVVDEYGTPISAGMIAGVKHVCRFKYRSADDVWLLMNPARVAQMGRVQGLRAANNSSAPTTKMDVTSGRVLAQSTAGATIALDIASTLTCDITTAGPAANGRDQAGAFSSGDTVHFFFIWNGTSKALVASKTTTPLSGPTLPSGYTQWAYLFTVVLPGTDLPLVYVRGRSVYYASEQVVVNTSCPTVEQTVNVATVVPAIAMGFELADQSYTALNAGGHNSILYLRIATGVNFTYRQNFAEVAAGISSHTGSINMPNVGQQFFYLWTHSTTRATESTRLTLVRYSVPNGDA